MNRIFFVAFLLITGTMSAGLSIKNDKDRSIFEDAVVLSSQMLSKNAKDKAANALLKFASWMDKTDSRVKEMKAKAVFGDPISALSGSASRDLLVRKLINRSEELRGETSKRMLYIVVGKMVDPSNAKITALHEELKAGRFDLTLSKLIEDSASPERVDLAEEKRLEEERQRKIEADNQALKEEYGKVSEEDVNLILDNSKFKAFSYSESSILDAINRITHKLYWRGIQMKITGKRISYTKAEEATNGAVFYYGPLFQPNVEEYAIENKTIRQVLDHISANIGVMWRIGDGYIEFYDDLAPDAATPEDGFAASDIQALLKGNLKDLLKYRGQELEMNGLITGIGRGMVSNDRYFSLDGGLTRIEFKKDQVNERMFKRLEKSVEDWRLSGGRKAMLDKIRDARENGEELDRRTMNNANAFIRFRGVVHGIDRGRLLFKEVKFIRIEETGEYLIKNNN